MTNISRCRFFQRKFSIGKKLYVYISLKKSHRNGLIYLSVPTPSRVFISFACLQVRWKAGRRVAWIAGGARNLGGSCRDMAGKIRTLMAVAVAQEEAKSSKLIPTSQSPRFVSFFLLPWFRFQEKETVRASTILHTDGGSCFWRFLFRQLFPNGLQKL